MFKFIHRLLCAHKWRTWAAYNATIFQEDKGAIKENQNVVVFKCDKCGKYIYDYNHT